MLFRVNNNTVIDGPPDFMFKNPSSTDIRQSKSFEETKTVSGLQANSSERLISPTGSRNTKAANVQSMINSKMGSKGSTICEEMTVQ